MNADDSKMPLMDHLRELRRRVMTSAAVVVVCTAVAYFFSERIFAWLVRPMNEALVTTGAGTLAIVGAMEGITVQLKLSGVAGLFFASPVVFWQVWRFVAPGLYDAEKRWVLPLVAASTTLFAGGALFCYYVVFQLGFPVFLTMTPENVEAVLSIDSYLGMALTLLVTFGGSFQLPIVVYFLARLGLIDHIDMIKGFRYSVVAIAVVAAVLTPPDVMSQVLMAIPLIILYIASIGVARIFTTKIRPPAGALA